MAEYSDLDRRLDALVRIAAAQSQRLHEMNVATRERRQRIDPQRQQFDWQDCQQLDEQSRLMSEQTLQIMEQGRRIDRIVDAFMRRHEQRRSIDSREGRVTGIQNDPPKDEGNA